jgi:hypothetical protein
MKYAENHQRTRKALIASTHWPIACDQRTRTNPRQEVIATPRHLKIMPGQRESGFSEAFGIQGVQGVQTLS